MTKVEKELHVPVMLKEILEIASPVLLDPENESPRYFDGTLGRGGHLSEIMKLDSRIKGVAFDRDPEALEYVSNLRSDWIQDGRLLLKHSNYVDFSPSTEGLFDFMLLDLGVSSPQLDEGRRGFSFYHEGPLDMRMDNTKGDTAADLIANYDEEDLTTLFQKYGEISRPYRVIRAILHDRKDKPFETTRQLAGLIERVDGWHRKGHHPATNYFMALRLKVNEELDSTERSLRPLIHGLKPGGRLAVLTFHSLEDRIVKNLFKDEEELGSPLFKKVIKPTWEESQKNSRARSAKLRVFERGNHRVDTAQGLGST
ncbi:MAG: 16S rRNA (cytosine(1402)-N(4))-methyltransferase RsmH [Bdellovibrionaceae bacterium]|nr:16S rRNA (cytosine(1402)-N(4))-methyltransferase RsmH [Pseudobdellovibrionaceae bacterium]